ncbi:MAG: hypothetical protein I8H71_00440 [Xanthomonadaceae bacterium]|nr:hypothetical protein [Xanthomonadaceae bacterium]MBH2008141.1 hypothetical protein [Xanthomonadaceae bacterium]
MTLTITQPHRDARSQATITYADLGAGRSKLDLYDASNNLLVSMSLKKPSGTIVSGFIVLEQYNTTGDLILLDGDAVIGKWVNGDGVLMAQGDVSDMAGAGDFKVSGTTGTTLYAGAYALLGTTSLS